MCAASNCFCWPCACGGSGALRVLPCWGVNFSFGDPRWSAVAMHGIVPDQASRVHDVQRPATPDADILAAHTNAGACPPWRPPVHKATSHRRRHSARSPLGRRSSSCWPCTSRASSLVRSARTWWRCQVWLSPELAHQRRRRRGLRFAAARGRQPCTGLKTSSCRCGVSPSHSRCCHSVGGRERARGLYLCRCPSWQQPAPRLVRGSDCGENAIAPRRAGDGRWLAGRAWRASAALRELRARAPAPARRTLHPERASLPPEPAPGALPHAEPQASASLGTSGGSWRTPRCAGSTGSGDWREWHCWKGNKT